MFPNLKRFFDSRVVKIFTCLIAILLLGYLAFQYALITKGFPTGDDPAIHIYNIRHYSYLELFRTNYPLPIIIFKLLTALTGLSYPISFVFTISLYLFFSAVVFFFFLRKITASNIISFIGAAGFALGLWMVDGLRMGLLAEAFGWGMLLLTLLFLSEGLLAATLISTLLLIFSHPFSFLVYALIFIMYFFIAVFSHRERKNVLWLGGIYLFAFIISYLIYPALITKFFDFNQLISVGWGERKLWEVLISDDSLRAVGLLFSVAGLIYAIQEWKKPAIKVSFLLLFVGLFMAMNQIFGIRFLVFRFYPYLEMAVLIFMAIGLYWTISILKLKKFYSVSLAILLGIIILYPHFKGNNVITSYQVDNKKADDSMTMGDREAIKWLGDILDPQTRINAPYKRVIWIRALTSTKAVYDHRLFDGKLPAKPGFDYSYIYYPEIYRIPNQISKNYPLVYNQNGVKIYKVK